MSRILHRQTNATYPTAVAGDGPYLIDAQGRRYLDASGGAAVSCLGHSRRDVIEAIKNQLDRLPYAHTAFFTNEPSEALAEHLTARAPEGLDRVYFVSGGSEANETALKLARQAVVDRGEPARTKVIARRQSYHGNTLGALAVSGNPGRRVGYEEILADHVHFVSPCYPYRHQRDDEDAEAYGLRLAEELEQTIRAQGPETVMAVIAEPVVGATLGAVPAVPGYLKRVREVCDRHGVLLILDEVMCGMGRTGTLYACAQDGVAPDLLTCAKALGAGYQPVGAVLLSEELYRTVTAAGGSFRHGFTYIGHPTACAGALGVQRAIEAEGLLANVTEQGARLRTDLEARFGDHPHVGDIRGRGLFQALELVADRASKTPFEPSQKLHARVKSAAFARGLICYPNAGTADGTRGDHVLLAPPYILEDGQRRDLVDLLADSLDAALAEVQVSAGTSSSRGS